MLATGVLDWFSSAHTEQTRPERLGVRLVVGFQFVW